MTNHPTNHFLIQPLIVDHVKHWSLTRHFLLDRKLTVPNFLFFSSLHEVLIHIHTIINIDFKPMVMPNYSLTTLFLSPMLNLILNNIYQLQVTLEYWSRHLLPTTFLWLGNLTSPQVWFFNHIWLHLLLNSSLKVPASEFCNPLSTFKS